MERAGRRPEWVVPTWQQVSDLACLAMRAVVEERSAECAGMVASVGWIRGHVIGPITGRDDVGLGRRTAVAELWAAAAAQPSWPTPPLVELCATLGVDHREPFEVDPRYAHGVWLTLRWLTGTGDQPAPLNLPVRNGDGTVASAEDIYAHLAMQQGVGVAEARAELRARAGRAAERSRRLAELVADATNRVRS